MKRIEDLEKRLRSWTPRSPSARIEQSIFQWKDPSGASHARILHPSWLVPAAAACLLLLNVVKPPDGTGVPSFPGPMVAVLLSNQTAAAYLSSAYKPQANGVPAESFEWTNGGALTSSITSISTRKGSYNDK